jgi:hypothetical protein
MRRAMKTGAQTLHLSCRRCIIGWVWVQSESSPSSCSLYTKSGFVPYRTHGLSPLAITSPTWIRMQARTTGDGPKHCPPQPDAPWPMPRSNPAVQRFALTATQFIPAFCPAPVVLSTRCGCQAERRRHNAAWPVTAFKMPGKCPWCVCCISYVLCVMPKQKRDSTYPSSLALGPLVCAGGPGAALYDGFSS